MDTLTPIDRDLFYNALNYRAASSGDSAERAWQALLACHTALVDEAVAAERERCKQAVAATPAVGDYVLATKWSDGDPGDPWALGFYAGELDMGNDREKTKVAPRYLVHDGQGKNIRPNGYRRVARIRKDVGGWLLLVAAKQLEASPPGTVNLWTMLTPAAFDVSDEKT